MEPYEVTLSQEESPALFRVSSRNVCFARNGGSVDVAMESNLDWKAEVSEGADWINVTQENNLMHISTSATATADGQHKGIVRVSAVDYPEFYTDINVTQTEAVYFDDFSWADSQQRQLALSDMVKHRPPNRQVDSGTEELNPGWTSEIDNYVYSLWHFLRRPVRAATSATSAHPP